MSVARRNPTLLFAGSIAVVGNLLAVALLGAQPAAYRLATLDDWAQQVSQHPAGAAASAIAFTLGLIALGIWALELGAQLGGRLAKASAQVIAIGALFDALGAVAPLVLAIHVREASAEGARPVARALLGFSLDLDSLFNLCLALGLVGLGLGWPKREKGPWRGLAIVSGLLSLPVSAQALVDEAVRFLPVAAPFWLTFVGATALKKWKPDESFGTSR